MSRLLSALALLVASRSAAADPQPVIGVDDARTHGPVALNHVEPSIGVQYSKGPDDSLRLYTLQLGLSPSHYNGRFGELLDWTKRYGAHVRFTLIDSVASTQGGPMTIGLHRYVPVEVLEFAPLLHIHTGLSFAVATPWLSGRMETAPPVLQVTNAIHSELRDNGWSLRPLEGYVRFDFLACRAIHIEAGGSPEAFIPATGAQPTSYNLRGHVEVGFSFACPHSAMSAFHPLAFLLEYRGRTRLYQAGASVSYYDLLSAGFQYNMGRVLVGAFFGTDPGSNMGDYFSLTARLQVGFWGTR